MRGLRGRHAQEGGVTVRRGLGDLCDECRHVVALLEGFVDAEPPKAQAVLQINNLRRLRRVEQVVYELIHRRIFSALVARATWDEIAEALGMTPDEARKRYSMGRANPDTGGWD